jgi:flagellar M-ring protein FliF
MVIRPLVKRILTADPVPEPVAALTDGATAEIAAPANMIDVAQVQGQVHAQSVHRVGELADRNPNETAAIIRQWLTEPAT